MRGMSDKQYYGKSFQFDNDFMVNQKQIGDIRLYQLGEVCYENGHEVEPHRQICHEITYIISGKAKIYCNDICYQVGQGDIIINSKDQIHSIEVDNETKLRYFYIGFEFDEHAYSELTTRLASFYADKYNNRVVNDEYNIMVFFTRLLDEMYNGMDFSEILIRDYIEQILIMVYRAFHDRHPIHMDAGPSSVSVGDTTYLMIRYIEDHILSLSNLTEISDHLGYSYNYLSHLFKRKMGISIQTYLNYKKITKSIELIDSGRMSITDISTALNYQTVQAFSKSFKKVMNMSPSDYKKSMKIHSVEDEDNV